MARYPDEVYVHRDSTPEEIEEKIMKIYEEFKPIMHEPMVIKIVMPLHDYNPSYMITSLHIWYRDKKPFKDPFDHIRFCSR